MKQFLFRVHVMEAELGVAVEKVTQLQGEKEKALADLNNIRKINRTIERLVAQSIFIEPTMLCGRYVYTYTI